MSDLSVEIIQAAWKCMVAIAVGWNTIRHWRIAKRVKALEDQLRDMTS